MTAETAVAEPAAVKKVSKSETGHAKNAANFEELIVIVRTFGSAYNPSAEALFPANLEALRDKTGLALKALQSADSVYRDAVNRRQAEFSKMNFLTTRIRKAVKASGADGKVNEDISSICKKIKGEAARKEKDVTGVKSVSQQSFDNRAYNFRQLVIRLAGIPQYKPNETELALAGLESYVATLDTVTSGAQNAEAELNKMRRERDQVMYTDESGTVPVALKIKDYIVSVFGTKSPEYKSISKLQFKNR